MDSINFGFVSICLSEKDCSPAGSVTVKQVENLDREATIYRVLRVARTNLQNTLRIMWFMRAHDIALYRISAMLIPLATHEKTDGWAWWEEESLLEVGEKIGSAVQEHGFRLSSHLPELCGLSSDALFHWTQSYAAYHRRLYDLLRLDESAIIIIHVGGAHGNKERALETARRNLERLDPWMRARLALENDDKVFDIEDVVSLASASGVRAVFDWHHHVVNPPNGEQTPDGAKTVDLVARAADAWKDRPFKVHVSSPKSDKQIRAHADYVDPKFARPLFDVLRAAGVQTCDVMVEAKKKDLALLELRKALEMNEVNV